MDWKCEHSSAAVPHSCGFHALALALVLTLVFGIGMKFIVLILQYNAGALIGTPRSFLYLFIPNGLCVVTIDATRSRAIADHCWT